MPNLLPFRDYDEHDVVNLFAWSGSIPVNKGTVVKAVASGWRTDETDTLFLGNVGASYPNIVSQRYGTLPAVTAAGTGDNVLGILLYDVKEQDENGRLLKFHPQKAAEMQVALSGQSVPILTQGFVLYSGSQNGGYTAGALAYPSGQGDITTNSINQVNGGIVGKFYGAPNGNGWALLHVKTF